MKPYCPRFPILLSLIALGIVKPNSAHAQSHYLMRLTGSIDHRLAIEMVLKRDGKKLEGVYFYDRIGMAIQVEGTLSKTGHVQLSEGDASFSGTLVKGKRLTGTWQKAKGGKAHPVILYVEANPPAKREVPGSALLEEKTLRIQRSQKMRAHRPSATQILLRYPVVRGSHHTGTFRKLNHALSPSTIHQLAPGEKLADDGWLDEIDYDVNYNRHSLLDITFSVSGVGGYPDTFKRHVLLNLKTGAPVRAADVFAPRALRSLAKLVDKHFQVEVRDEHSNAKELGETDMLGDNLHFEVEDLNHFSVGEKGLTFNAEYHFRYASKFLESIGLFFYPYTKLRPYIRKDGPLAPFYATRQRKGRKK